MSSSTPPSFPASLVQPSEHAPGGYQVAGIADPRDLHDLSTEQRAERHRANLVPIETVEKMCSAVAFTFLRDYNLLGRTERQVAVNFWRPWERPMREYYQRDVVEGAFQLLRDVVSGLPKR